MARQGESGVGHRLFRRRDGGLEPNKVYADRRINDQWNTLTRFYKPKNVSEVMRFLSEGFNARIIDYLITVYAVLSEVFQPEALLLELFQDPEIVENRHLVTWIGIRLPSQNEIIKVFAKQQGNDTSIPRLDDIGKRLDRITEWWLTAVPRELLDIVYFDVFDVSDAEESGDES